MIVVDTGSTDRTPEIARELGGTVSSFPWRDDFSAARNESIRRASGEWIFWMDSDDTIDEENGRKLREFADQDHEEVTLGYVAQVHCPGPNPSDPTAAVVVRCFGQLDQSLEVIEYLRTENRILREKFGKKRNCQTLIVTPAELGVYRRN